MVGETYDRRRIRRGVIRQLQFVVVCQMECHGDRQIAGEPRFTIRAEQLQLQCRGIDRCRLPQVALPETETAVQRVAACFLVLVQFITLPFQHEARTRDAVRIASDLRAHERPVAFVGLRFVMTEHDVNRIAVAVKCRQ